MQPASDGRRRPIRLDVELSEKDTVMNSNLVKLFMVASLLAAPIATFAQAPSKVVLQIHEVVCVDETNSGRIIGENGKDHMILGAVTIAPNGRRSQIRSVKVGSFSKDGKRNPFSPPLAFASIPVAKKLREYGILFVLAEQDISGGTDEAVKKLVEDADVSGGSDKGDDKADGGASAVGKEVAKEALKELAEFAVGRLKKNAKDDIFKPQAASVVLGADFRFPNGKTSTEPEIETFKGHGGKYTIKYSWTLAP
jgi:hypothetical protein